MTVILAAGLILKSSFPSPAQVAILADQPEAVSIPALDVQPLAAPKSVTVFRLTDYLKRGRNMPPYPGNFFPQCPAFCVNTERNILLVDDRKFPRSASVPDAVERVAHSTQERADSPTLSEEPSTDQQIDSALRTLEAEYGLPSPPMTAGWLGAGIAAADPELAGALNDLRSYYDLIAETAAAKKSNPSLLTSSSTVSWLDGPTPLESYSYPSNTLWLEITGVSNQLVYLTLHGTVADVSYEVLQRENLADTNGWASAGTPVLGAAGQDWTATTVSMQNHTNHLFLSAKSWLDAEGNGLPDWWELQFFGTAIP